jgi:hypothetical protein
MERLCGILLAAGAYPLYRLWRGAAASPLGHAAAWAAAAWLAACAAWLAGGGHEGRYIALALAACAGVAVLGARRPGVAAWNFVVAGLLAVLLRPYLQGLGELKLEAPHLVVLAAALAVAAGNYLPTRQGVTALAFAAWCAVEVAALAGVVEVPAWVMPLALAPLPWLALASRPGGDDAWRSFRDSYGFVWAQRTREQFTRAAENAGLNVELRWDGLRGEDAARGAELLRSLLRRFVGPGGTAG